MDKVTLAERLRRVTTRVQVAPGQPSVNAELKQLKSELEEFLQSDVEWLAVDLADNLRSAEQTLGELLRLSNPNTPTRGYVQLRLAQAQPGYYEACKRGLRAAVDRLNQLADAIWTPATSTPTAAREVEHSDDFCSVLWYGTLYRFTKNQAACVKLLWEHWERGGMAVGKDAILEAAGGNSNRIDHIFRDNTAWGTMIVSIAKGVYQLQEPELEKKRKSGRVGKRHA